MPRYRIKLVDPDSEEFRVVVTHADSEEAAIAAAMRNEAKAVAYRSEPKVLADDLDGYLEKDEVKALRAAQHAHEDDAAAEVDRHDEKVAQVLEDLPRGAKRGRLHMHRQSKPYEIVSVSGGEGK